MSITRKLLATTSCILLAGGVTLGCGSDSQPTKPEATAPPKAEGSSPLGLQATRSDIDPDAAEVPADIPRLPGFIQTDWSRNRADDGDQWTFRGSGDAETVRLEFEDQLKRQEWSISYSRSEPESQALVASKDDRLVMLGLVPEGTEIRATVVVIHRTGS